MFGMETSPAELDAVLTKCRDHRQNVQQLLLKQEYQRSQAAMRQKMLENLDDSVKGQKSKVSFLLHFKTFVIHVLNLSCCSNMMFSPSFHVHTFNLHFILATYSVSVFIILRSLFTSRNNTFGKSYTLLNFM